MIDKVDDTICKVIFKEISTIAGLKQRVFFSSLKVLLNIMKLVNVAKSFGGGFTSFVLEFKALELLCKGLVDYLLLCEVFFVESFP